jgi:hypothetical protein
VEIESVKHVCNTCKRALPASAFFPSTLSRRKGRPYCRECLRDKDRKKTENSQLELVEKIKSVYGSGTWTAKQAIVLLDKGNLLGAGALARSMVNRGLIVKVSEGKYRIANPNAPAQSPALTIAQLPIQIEERATPASAVSRTVIETEPVFLEVGAYVFPSTVLIERDDRGGAVITMPVAEHHPQTGKSLPQEIQLTPEEWATRRRVTLSDLIGGSNDISLFDRVAELERANDALRRELAAITKDRNEWQALAEGYQEYDWLIEADKKRKAA